MEMKKFIYWFTTPLLVVCMLITFAVHIRAIKEEVLDNQSSESFDLLSFLMGITRAEPLSSYYKLPMVAKFTLNLLFYVIMIKIIF